MDICRYCINVTLDMNVSRCLKILLFALIQMLLRVKENELQYLHRETSCLRDELHSLNKVMVLVYMCLGLMDENL